jgi:hypothetical protein
MGGAASRNSGEAGWCSAGELWVGDQELTYDSFVAEERSGAAPAGSDGGAGWRQPLERLLW